MAIVLLPSALLVLGLAFQGSRGIFETTEGRYSSVASEMLRLDDWLVPHLNEETPHFTKPPLTYWLLAAGIRTLGRNEMAVRLPGAIAFILTVLVVAQAGRLLTPARPLLPAVIYATFLFPASASNVVSTDNILTLFEGAAMVAFATHYFGGGRHRSLPAILGWACFGLAFLTKGYPALLPMIALGLFHYRRGRHISSDPLLPVPGLLLFAVLGAGWFIVVISREPALLEYFVRNELLGRVAGQHNRNPEWYKAFTVYGPVILLGTIPWTLVALRALREAFGELLRGRGRAPAGTARRQDVILYLVLWLTVPTLVFLLVRSRLVLYLLPQFAPLALLMALFLSRRPVRRYSPAVRACIGAAAVLALRIAAAEVPSDSDSRPVARQVAALSGGLPGEIVFVGARPSRGVAFYLGAEVERVEMSPQAAERLGVESLDEELEDRETDRIWLVPASLADSFRAYAVATGAVELKVLGEIVSGKPQVVFASSSLPAVASDAVPDSPAVGPRPSVARYLPFRREHRRRLSFDAAAIQNRQTTPSEGTIGSQWPCSRAMDRLPSSSVTTEYAVQHGLS